MSLPLKTTYAPMDALLVDDIPEGDSWQYEPKWDGFRCLAFRDGRNVELQSKSGQPLARYFPELTSALRELTPQKFVLDTEIIVPVKGILSFDDLLQRIHPAESRIKKLAVQTPAKLVVFDLLVDEKGKLLTSEPLTERRQALERFSKKYFENNPTMMLSPATTDVAEARHWFEMVGGGLDGIICKRTDVPYASGERTGMVKIKKMRTADCVVGGFRYASNAKVVGSLLLGLYNNAGLLDHVGFCSGFKAVERKTLLAKLEPLIKPPGFTGNAPGGPSRWSTERSAQWLPLATKLVVEVRYDHFTGGRFRHGTKLLRWRPDKSPRQCLTSQVEQEEHASLLDLVHA
jgi:ATP-dependent DNA ligase